MTLMLDPEPTLAAAVEDETQSLHAWSQEDAATDVVEYRQRSWKLPLAAALTAAAAITAGMFLAESATKPQVAPTKPQVAAPARQSVPASPPVQAQSPDQRFLNLVQQRGVQVVSKPMAITAAHWVCTQETKGFTDPDIAAALVKSTPGSDLRTESIFVDTVREVYCP